MPLDQQLKDMLDFIEAAGYPPIHESTPEDGRRAMRAMSVDLVTPGSIVQFPAQDRLPSAERVMAVLREQPVSKVSTWGQKRDVTLITPPAR